MDGFSSTAISAGGQPRVSDAPQDGFLFIGELAKQTGTDPKTIRFYERAELLSPPRHGRFRTYLASDVQRLKNVLTLRRIGMPLARIREIFAAAGTDSDILGNSRAAAMLRAHLRTLEERREEVGDQIRRISEALENFAT